MKLVFLGTPAAAVPSLDALVAAGHRVELVVSQPDRPVGRSRQPSPTPIRIAAERLGIERFQPRRVRDAAFRQRLAAARPDALVVVAYGRILTLPVLRLAPLGAINVHFSLLPRYRGAAPVQWALARAESRTGVTTMLMNERMDEGDLLLQRSVSIEPDEHAPALGERLSTLGAELIVDTLDRLREDSIRPRPQDGSQATLAPPLRREDGEVAPEMTALEIAGRVRGFDPWPGVWMRCGSRRVRLVAVRIGSGSSEEAAPGTILDERDGGLAVVCGGRSLLIVDRVQFEGRRPVGARDAINGRLVRFGDRFERACLDA